MAFDCDFLTPVQRIEFTSKPSSQQTARSKGASHRRSRTGDFNFMAQQIEGTVKHWRGEFGFVLGEDGVDYFLHSREFLKSEIAFPKLGDRMVFTPERGPKGLRAVGVRYSTCSD
jgi:cold shock CspA family protein